MACIKNRGWHYAKTPAAVKPRAAAIFEMRSVDLPEVKDGMILTRLSAIAVAPLARTYLELPGNDTGAEELGLKRTKIGEVVPCEAVAEVVETKSKKYKVGDKVYLPFNPLVEYSAHRDDGKDNPDGMAPIKLFPCVHPETQLTVLSPSAGITAHCASNHPCGRVVEGGLRGCLAGLFGCRKQKAVLVNSAAGAVGVVAGQLYKNQGCRVIGVTSSKEKAKRLVEEVGYDAAVAYKSEDLDKRLGELAPEGFDLFLDNVGAQQLDVGTKHMKIGGKVLSVGVMAEVDNFASGNIVGWKQYHRCAARELTFGGFLMYNHISEVPGAMISMGLKVWRGKVKRVDTVVQGNFEKWAECVDRVYDSETFGRLILMNDDVMSKAEAA